MNCVTCSIDFLLNLDFGAVLERKKYPFNCCDKRNKSCVANALGKANLKSIMHTVNRLFMKYYYDMKKHNGYSEMEIAQKREALENVLVPYHYDENRALLKIIQASQPESISNLAELTGRKQSNLSRTLKTMSSYGLVEMVRENRNVKPIAKATEFEILAA